MAAEPTGTIEPLEESWQQRFARRLAALRAALNEAKHPLLSIAEKAALRAGGLKGLPPPTDVGGLMSPDARPSGTGLGEFLIGDAPASFERWGRGDPPYTRGEPGLAGRLPALKPGRAQQAANIASMMPLDLVAGAATKPLVGVAGAVRRQGDVVPEWVAKKKAEYLRMMGFIREDSPIIDKLEKWLIRSAGKEDPILANLRPEDFIPAYNPPIDRPLQLGPFRYSEEAADLSTRRGLPPPRPGSLEELTDTVVFPLFKEGIGSPFYPFTNRGLRNEAKAVLQGKPPTDAFTQQANERGIRPENLAKLLELLPEDNIIATGELGTLANVSPFTHLLRSTHLFLNSPYAPPPEKLAKMTLPQIFDAQKRATVAALKELEKRRKGEVVLELPDGWSWRRLGAEQLQDEGTNMGHCVGHYCERVERGDTIIYSLRDKSNNPVVTLEVKPPNKVGQIKGLFDSSPADYLEKIGYFMSKQGLEVDPSRNMDFFEMVRRNELREGTSYKDLPKDAKLWLNLKEFELYDPFNRPMYGIDEFYRSVIEALAASRQVILSDESIPPLLSYIDDFFRQKFDYDPNPQVARQILEQAGRNR